MGKGAKSSASSATRKKHARKAGKDEEDLPPVNKQRGQKKQVRGADGKKLSKAQRKAAAKIKTYIPPPKPPAPPIPDPLDGQGLARTLPAELVVTLRRLGKKDDVTRRKGLEELREQWVAPVLRKPENEEEETQQAITLAALQSALPVWLHNLASLLQSPFHRSLTLQLHTDLMGVPELRGGVLDSLALSYLPGTQDRDILGSWLVAALEERKSNGLATFEALTGFGPKEAKEGEETSYLDLVPQLPALAEFLSLAILDPKTLHRDIHPPPVQSQFESAKQAKEAKNQNQKGKGGKGKPAKPATPVTATPPPEEDPQVAEERWTRYRVGGLAGLAWIIGKLHASDVKSEEIDALLHNPVTWSSLGPAHVVPGVDPIGTAPLIRRGGYNLLQSVLQNVPELDPELLRIVAASVLGNCWNEGEAIVWEVAGSAVLKFLTKYRRAWELESKSQTPEGGADAEGDEDDDDDEDEEEDDDAEESTPAPSGTATPAASEATTPAPRTSKAFDAFLKFISTVCPSLPHLTYPLLVVVVSTLPSTILPLTPSSLPLQNLFSHLWSAFDARLLSTHSLGGQTSAFQAFVQAAVDVTQLLIERTYASEKETAEWLVKHQLGGRVWGEAVILLGAKGGRRGTAPVETEAKILAQSASKLGKLLLELLTLLMGEVERTTLAACFPETGTGAFLPRALPALTELRDAAPEAVDATIRKIAEGCTEHLFQLENAPVYAEALTNILQKRQDLFPADQVSALSQGLQAHTAELVEVLPPSDVARLFGAVAAVAGPEKEPLLASLRSYAELEDVPREKRFALVNAIVGAGGLLGAGSLDKLAQEAVRSALDSNDNEAIGITSSALTSDDWLSTSERDSILDRVCAVVSDSVDSLLTSNEDAVVPASALSILASYAQQHIEQLVQSDEHILAVVAAHHYVILLPRLGLDIPTPVSASEIWKANASLSPEGKSKLDKAVTSSLAELLGRVTCRVGPGTIVDVALATDNGVSATPEHVASTLLPAPETLVEFLSEHTAQPPHPSLAVIDPMVPCTSDVEPSKSNEFDSEGRSRAARYAEAALALLREDKTLVKAFPSLLNVALAAMILAEDGAAVPGGSRGMYDAQASHLATVVRDAEGALSFSLSLVDEPPLSWHKETVEQLRAGSTPDSADYLQRLLGQLRARVAEGTSDVAARAFREVLSRHLRKCGAGEEEGGVWLQYALQISEKMPELCLAVLLSIKPFMLETQAFATAQNRLASGLAGIRIKDANAKGLPALRELIASAPPADSTSIFLPQQRAVFVLRHVGGWLTSEDEAADDLSEEIDVRVAELYTAIAPIVQDLSGGHWDSIFDLIDGALGSGSLDEPSAHPLLYAGLGLLRQVRDLASSNKQLAEWWEPRRDAHLGLVVELFLQCRDASSVPLQLIHAAILDLVHDAPSGVMAQAGLPQLCTLLTESSSAPIQTTAYTLLSQVIKQRTLALVLEVEASVADEPEENPRQVHLPSHLVSIVERGRNVEWDEKGDEAIPEVTAQLLAWLAFLDHFDDASRTLRWAYVDELSSSGLLRESLLPLLFAMLGVSEVGRSTFPASAYAVDEFYIGQLLPESLADLVPLASHVFYRSLATLPAAIRSYYEGLKDRQLSLALLQFTARHYSGVLIAHEFAALKEPSALRALSDEGLKVRVISGGGSAVAGSSGATEALASYTVDEQPMEIAIRLPAEFPLKGVEIRDVQRAGVPENKWRGWLMGVQQTVAARNGLILDALTVFKKNVALHFEGVVECAICYSIISLTDRTLPTKPCRTCKNRFHASCLFKWFNSSHSSSCPLCRSLF